MSRMLKSPAKYVQGKGVMRELDQYLQGMGKHLMILQTAGRRTVPGWMRWACG